MTTKWRIAPAAYDIQRLAREGGLTLHTCERWKAESHSFSAQVFGPLHCRTPIDYLICLHEIGHCRSSVARGLHLGKTVERRAAGEAAAWAWGIEHADPEVLERVTDAAYALAATAWMTHVRPVPAGYVAV